MKYYGLNVGHDSSLVGFDDNGELFFYAQSERFSPRFKGYGDDPNPLSPIYNSFPDLRINKNDHIVICSSYKDGKSFSCKEYDDLLVRNVDDNFAKEKIKNENIIPRLTIDHHLAHALSSWCFRKNDKEKLFLSYDGCGPWADSSFPYKSSLVGIINEKGFESLIGYEKIPSTMCLNNFLGKRTAGKIMGLSGYFSESSSDFTNEEFIRWINMTSESNFVYHRLFPTVSNPSDEDLLLFSKIYSHLTNFVWQKIKINLEKFSNNREVLISGGSALALDINTKIFNFSKNLTFGPPCDDSGLALGAACFSYFHVNKKWPKPISKVNINNLSSYLPKIGVQEPQELAKLLFENNIIGLLRDKSECGPRALGFRSILAQATKFENLEKVSQKLKGREYYRPLAPIVTDRSFDKYFFGPKGEHMQYKCICADECKKELPAIVHKDNSSRPQVVYQDKDPWLYELLVEYGKLSGHECLINTSLNGKNKPICNSFEDAVDDFGDKDISLISLGEVSSGNKKGCKLL